jgi:tetratricopeptide (TPR) repeat protein
MPVRKGWVFFLCRSIIFCIFGTIPKTRGLTKLNGHLSKLVICAFLITFPATTIAQVPVIDSLKNELHRNTRPERFKLNLYYQLAKQYQEVDVEKSLEVAFDLLEISKDNDSLFWSLYAFDLIVLDYEALNKFDSCVKYSRDAIDIAVKINKPWDVAYFRGMLGNAQINLGNYYDALENYRKAVEYSKNAEMTKYETAFLTNIGKTYHLLGDDLKALDYFLQSYYIKKDNKLTDNLAPSLINIASIYSTLEKYEEAINFHNDALKLCEDGKDDYYRMKALTGLGFDYWLMEKYDLSVFYYLEALQLSESLNDKMSEANIFAKLSGVYQETGKKEEALNCAEKSLALSREINYQYGISSFTRTLGDIYLSEKKYDKAFQLLQNSIEVSRSIGAMDNLKDSYFSISKLYEDINKKGRALEYYKLYSSIRDSLLQHEEADKFTVVQIKYEMEKKGREVENLTHENEIKELKLTKSKYLLFGFIVFFSMVFLFLVLLIRQNRIRNIQKTIVLEQRLLRSQMNPHFIFNTLTAIQKYIYDKSSLLATDYLGRFTKLMRFILHSSAIEQITLEDEITFLENYLKLQALRFNNKFDHEMVIDEEIEPENMRIPPMLIQPFVENSIEHGIKPLDKRGLIEIRFDLKGDYINVVVVDNGVGREKARKINEQDRPGHKSMAMEITKERLVYLNKKSNRKINFKIIDLIDINGQPKGTRVTLDIPFVYI